MVETPDLLGRRTQKAMARKPVGTISLLVDLSGSMCERMPEEGCRPRIEVAVEALLDWLAHQRVTLG